MKPVHITNQVQGMPPHEAEDLWQKIEGYAAYSFNKSHSVAYSLLSYQSMWLKVNHSAEFYAAALSILDEDKLPAIVKEAEASGVFIVPPDVNLSTNRFEIAWDSQRGQKILVTPFNRLKGLSDSTAKAIMEARSRVGTFTSKEHFVSSVEKRKVNAKHVTVLDTVGAFANIEGGSLPARHPDRVRDQIALMPGLVSAIVKADRAITMNRPITQLLAIVMRDAKECDKCSLKGGIHPLPRLGSQPKFVVVFDSPNFKEEKEGQLMVGDGAAAIRAALGKAYLDLNSAYWTTLVKSPKAAGEKFLANDQISACSAYLERELEILNPPVIVTMGTAATRYFLPEVRGSEAVGQAVFNAKRNATIVVGFNPGQLFHDPSKQATLDAVFAKVAEIVN